MRQRRPNDRHRRKAEPRGPPRRHAPITGHRDEAPDPRQVHEWKGVRNPRDLPERQSPGEEGIENPAIAIGGADPRQRRQRGAAPERIERDAEKVLRVALEQPDIAPRFEGDEQDRGKPKGDETGKDAGGPMQTHT